MCGRFGFDMPKPALEEQFGVQVDDDIPPSYNITPGQPILGVTLYEGQRQLMGYHWGLVPNWSKSAGRGHSNARSETVFEKTSFKDSAKYFRCLVPASFFYEWKKTGSRREPYVFMLEAMTPFAMAAIYAEHEKFGPSLALLTTSPNETMQPVHDRMPVILDTKDYAAWLDLYTHRDDVTALMAPYAGPMTAYPVSTRVNSPANNDRNLIQPVLTQGSLLG